MASRAEQVIAQAMHVDVGMGHVEPITEVYKPEGCAIAIMAALERAGYVIREKPTGWVPPPRSMPLAATSGVAEPTPPTDEPGDDERSG